MVPAGTSTFAAAAVRFTPGARTAWHTHSHGQTIFVTEGVGSCQREGGPIEELRPGDRAFFEPGENFASAWMRWSARSAPIRATGRFRQSLVAHLQFVRGGNPN